MAPKRPSDTSTVAEVMASFTVGGTTEGAPTAWSRVPSTPATAATTRAKAPRRRAASASRSGVRLWPALVRSGRKGRLLLVARPLHDPEVEHRDRVQHRHQQQGDEGGHGEAADLRVAERLPQRPAVRG